MKKNKNNSEENIAQEENTAQDDNLNLQDNEQNSVEETNEQQVQEDKVDEAEEWKQKYLYTLAELENFRKRVAKERSELIKYGARDVFYDLLEITDNFGRVIEADKKESDPKVIVQGIEMIYNQLLKLLQRYEVKPIEAKNKEFDPNVHEAMQKIPTNEHKPGTVIAEMQKGYKYRDKILRPARVVVAAEPEKEDE